ncbi:MAG: lipid-A-disaccharide synthase [Rickettsiales bacterium]|nr:MAG: lipid-A-disaccharide synthase [Rickettsiales bacterium]
MEKKKKKIFIIAGEASGDLYGANFISAMPDYEFVGVGGERMEELGFTSLFNINEIAVMGIFEVLPRVFKINSLIKKTIKEIEKQKPDLILTIDSPGFCFRVIKKLKHSLAKKVHLVAPTVWAWKPKRAKKISKMFDLLLCLLPFEPPYFEKWGLKSKFIGHPIFDGLPEQPKQRFSNYTQTIVLTPGSRKGEILKIYPIMIKTINILRKKFDIDVQVFATKNTKILLEYITMNEFFACNIITDKTKKENILKSTNFAIAKSGTNTFEFNIYHIPIVVVYTMNYFTNKIGKFLIKSKFANLVNVIAKREIIPEFIGEKANPYSIANKIDELLKNSDATKKQIADTTEIIKELGYLNEETAIKRAVKEIEEVIL